MSATLNLALGFPPFLDLPDTTFRYKASEQGLTAGQTILTFRDISGNSKDLTAYGSPIMSQVVGVGGKTFLAVALDGVDDKFSSGSNAIPVNGYSRYILATVSNCTDASFIPQTETVKNTLLMWEETNFWGIVNLAPYQGTVMCRYGTGQGGNLPSYTRSSNIGTSLTTSVWVKDGSTEYLYVDGILVATFTGKNTTIANTSSMLTIGFANPTPSYYKGNLIETFGITGKADAETISKINQYLKSVYL